MSTKDNPKVVENAVENFCNGFNCSQAILTAYCDKYGIPQETALRISTGFGGGIGRSGQTCGAITGAVAVIGLEKGPTSPDDKAAKEATYQCVREFTDKFAQRHNATMCRDLLGCNIGDPEGYKQAREDDLFKKRCPDFVKSAMDILQEILD